MSLEGILHTVIWTELVNAIKADGVDFSTEKVKAGPQTRAYIGSLIADMGGIPLAKCRGVADTHCGYLAHCGAICNKCGRVHDLSVPRHFGA